MNSYANRGRRPVTLKQAFLLLPRKGYLLCTDLRTAGRPIELAEGKSHDYFMFEDGPKDKGLTQDKYVAFVRDATGRSYYSHNILKRFLELHRIK